MTRDLIIFRYGVKKIEKDFFALILSLQKLKAYMIRISAKIMIYLYIYKFSLVLYAMKNCYAW